MSYCSKLKKLYKKTNPRSSLYDSFLKEKLKQCAKDGEYSYTCHFDCETYSDADIEKLVSTLKADEFSVYAKKDVEDECFEVVISGWAAT